ncbi:conserved domain-containing protein [Blastococcus fimeti]|nr:conserved domain-containing protein [Blastococcus fimeti]
MITEQQLSTVIGSTAVGADGKLGTVGEVYLDDETGRPEWATVRTGMFGTKESFVPLAEADLSGSDLRLPYDKDKVKNAPQIDTDGHLSPDEEADLYRYYGVGTGTEFADTTTTETTGTTSDRTNAHGTVGHDTSGPTTDNAMTRSEEQLRVGTERVEAGRARLRKYVVSENVTQTVPVTHEEIRVEREPITDANIGNALDGPAISEEEHEVVLHAERPVVAKEAVPVERVRLDTQTVTEQETVNETVRKEQIEFDDETTTRRS